MSNSRIKVRTIEAVNTIALETETSSLDVATGRRFNSYGSQVGHGYTPAPASVRGLRRWRNSYYVVEEVELCQCGEQSAEECASAYPLCTKIDPQPRMTATEVANGQAFKADDGKLRWGLLLNNTLGVGKAVRAVVRVLNFAVRSKDKGGKGYTPHSWREVPNAKERYEDALHRHLDALREGETHDAESGESHWAHVATNALFLHELHEVK